jgi:hypothetical protein
VSTYESLRAQIEAHEAEEARLTTPRQVASGGVMEFLCITAKIRREAFAEAIDLIEQRAVDRGRQVDVAQAAGGAWEVVAGKSSELQAVADLLRRRLPVLTPSP